MPVLICRERTSQLPVEGPQLDQTRRFEGIWTQDRYVSQQSAQILLDRIADYRPELANKVQAAKAQYIDPAVVPSQRLAGSAGPDPFTQRLVTYLQAGQYKLFEGLQSDRSSGTARAVSKLDYVGDSAIARCYRNF